MKLLYSLLALFVLWGCQSGNGSQASDENASDEASASNPELVSGTDVFLDSLQLPEGFSIEIFGRVDNARSMAMSPNGTLFVGNRGEGGVYAVRDINGDYKIDERYQIAKDLTMPNGVAFKDGDLYVAEVSKLWKYSNIEENLSNPPAPELIYEDYPTDKHHGWKYIAFGPDGKLYVPVGAPCNICESENEIYASITRMDANGANREVFVSGVRNTVGFTWHPETGDLWFTDNGRDMLGDDIPPCELNRASAQGQHFGYPYCHGGTIKDPEFGDKFPCENFVKPAQNLDAHVAPLGVKFYTGSMFPESYKNIIFVAEHGSWNRSPEAGHSGHRVTMVREENGQGVAYEPFITGFLNKSTNQAWGRPVDILVLEDGSMLLSDDLSGTIYRITYKES
ncbi:MAG: sorbosone dehydrogenase family protein [Cyclobacteriaceae bacterium]|nr:sorbosone dehydrogenase family protein [Cyclobacteriaceae bacterium]